MGWHVISSISRLLSKYLLIEEMNVIVLIEIKFVPIEKLYTSSMIKQNFNELDSKELYFWFFNIRRPFECWHVSNVIDF